MSHFTLYTNPFHNCRSITLSAMLLRLGVPIGYVWHQAGLFYLGEGQEQVKIDPYYQDITENDHGVKWELEHYNDLNTHNERICDLLEAGHTLALAVDIYDLPYSMYCGHHHQSHTVEIMKKEDGHFTLADHFYHYFGPIEVDALKKAVDAYCMHIHQGPYDLLYAEAVEVPKCYTTNDLLRALDDNCSVMQGERLYDLRDMSLSMKVGMEAITAIIHRAETLMQLDVAAVEEDLDDLFSALKEIANSRHLFHEYLKLFHQEELANELHETSQNWIVASHMLLRGKALGDLPAMLPRAMKRLLRVQEKEQQNLQHMRALLQTQMKGKES